MKLNNYTLFNYSHIDNHRASTLFLFHGTGGTERDFLFLDKPLNRSYNLVGLRGNVDESGMTRFFRRKSEGIFDQQSIREEAQKLNTFIKEWVKGHAPGTKHCVFFGYSNGANMILSLIFLYPELITRAVLLHPMLPFDPSPSPPDLKNHTIFVSYGLQDPLVSPRESRKSVDLLVSFGADVVSKSYPSGHEITKEELSDAVAFIKKNE